MLWGKTDDLRAPTKRRGLWLPLVTHLSDAASVAERIFDGLGELSREPLRHGLSTDREARDRFVALAGLHDIGKATPAHVHVIGDHPTAAKRLVEIKDSGLIVEGITKKDMHHSLAAYPILIRRFGARARSFASIVSAHHGWAHDEAALSDSLLPLDDLFDQNLGWYEAEDSEGDWWEVQNEIIDTIIERFSIDPSVISVPIPHYDHPVATGLVMLSDWLASDSRYFFMGDAGREWTTSRSSAAWKAIGFPSPWVPQPDEEGSLYLRRFDDFRSGKYAPYPMQLEVERIVEALDSPALVVVESGMGSGKTEASLIAGEIFTRNLGGSGICFSMPTMATTDSVFERVMEWAKSAAGDAPLGLHLGHGRNTFSKSFQSLLSGSALNMVLSSDDESSDGSVTASRVLSEKMGLFSPVSVNTVDQVAKLALTGYSTYPLQGALVGKTVVFDEVHTYDSYTMEFLLLSLSYLAAHRCPVVVLSATLSPERRADIADAYVRGARGSWCDSGEGDITHSPPDAYPLITVADPRSELSYVSVNGDSGEPEKKIHIEVHLDSSDELLSRLISVRTPNGGCVGVIRSTVERSQQAYLHLKAAFPNDEIILLHSRHTSKHRDEKIAEIESVVGKKGTRPRGGERYIVVSTQVIEQSMDFDFDYMISDVAPLDMLAQRTGREWRHQKNTDAGRPVDRAVFDIVSAEVSPEQFCYRTSIESKIGFIYNHFQLHVAAAEMSEIGVFQTPQGISELILKMGVKPEDGAPLRMHAQWENQDREQREKAREYGIEPVPHRDGDWHTHSGVECNVKGGSRQRRSSIRDADGSVEGILLVTGSPQKTVDGLPVDDLLNTEHEIEIGSNTIRLPVIHGLHADHLEARKSWDSSPVLKGRKIIPIHRGEINVGGVRFTYSRELGLIRIRPDHDEF